MQHPAGRATREAAIATLKRSARRIVATARAAIRHRVPSMAAEVAFFALLSITPLVLAVAGAVGYSSSVVGQENVERAEGAIVDALGGFLDTDATASVEKSVGQIFDRGHGELLSIGTLLALWSGSRLLRAIIDTLNDAYEVEERRTWVHRIGVSVSLTAALVLAAAGIAALLTLGDDVQRQVSERWPGPAGPLLRAAHLCVLTIALLLVLVGVYRLAPNRSSTWSEHVPGAVLALGMGVGAAVGLRVYLAAGLGGAFGAVGAPVVVLLWLYASSAALLLGGVLNAQLPRHAGVVPEGGSTGADSA